MKRQMIRFSFILSFLFGLEMLRIYPSLLYMKTQGKYSLLENKVGLAASDFYKHVTKKGGPSSPSGREPGRLRIRTGFYPLRHAEGWNSTNMGNNSSLPASISRLSTTLAKGP